jgi:hypothetical protein
MLYHCSATCLAQSWLQAELAFLPRFLVKLLVARLCTDKEFLPTPPLPFAEKIIAVKGIPMYDRNFTPTMSL